MVLRSPARSAVCESCWDIPVCVTIVLGYPGLRHYRAGISRSASLSYWDIPVCVTIVLGYPGLRHCTSSNCLLKRRDSTTERRVMIYSEKGEVERKDEDKKNELKKI
jgi:hypothetical protein